MATRNTVQVEFTGDGRQLKREAAESEKSVTGLAESMGRIAVPAAGIASVYALGSAVETITEKSMQYLSTLETANLGIGSSFMTGGKYVDQTTGKVLQGQAALNAAQADSRITMEHLQVANMQTIATLDQLVRAYQEALPVAQARGFNRGQVEQFTTAMVQAAGAIDASGALMHQLGEETRSLLTGNIDPRTSRIAMAIGIRPEDIRAHKGNADELFSYLMEKLSAYTVAGIESQKTMAGLTSNAKDIALQAGGQAFQPLFEAVKYELTEITGALVTIDEKTRKITWNSEFMDGVTSVKGGLNAMIAEAYRFSMLLDLAGGSMTALGSRALKVAEVVTRFMTIGQFGDSLERGAEGLKGWNKLYEERYKKADQALQALANREAGLGAAVEKTNAAYQQNAPGKDEKEEEKARQQAEKARRQRESISMIMAGIRARDLLIGKQSDEKELIQLDQKHREELKRLKDLHAGKDQIEDAQAAQRRERADLASQRKLEKEKALAAAELGIAVKNYQDQAAWLDKLDSYKLKAGKISEEAALSGKYDRERQLLNLKQEEIALSIEQEQNEAKRNELMAEYWRIEDGIVRSKQEEAQETALLRAGDKQRTIEHQQRLEQLAFEHEQRMTGISATSLEARLQFIGQDETALQAHYTWKNEQISQQHAFEVKALDEKIAALAERDDLSLKARLDKQMEYEARKFQIQAEQQEATFQLQQEYGQRQAELWWSNAQTYIGFAQQMATMGIQMMLFDEKGREQIGKRMLATAIRFLAQSLQAFMFSKAKEHVFAAYAHGGQIQMQMTQHTASLAMLEAEAVAWAAFLSALAMNPYGGQAVIPAAAAMTGVAGVGIPAAMTAVGAAGGGGISTELGMAALWTAGGVMAGALGEAAASSVEGGTSGSSNAAGYGSGTPGSPVVTQSAQQPAAPTYNIHIYGNVVDQDKFARELVPSINKAIADGVH